MDYSPLLISLKVSIYGILIILITALPSAWISTFYMKKYKGILDSIFTLPMVLPPTVVGFFLLVILGKRGLLGNFFENLGFGFIFSSRGAVVAVVIVAFPLMYKTVSSAFEEIDENIISAARLLGASELKLFFTIGIPLSIQGIAAGVVLSFARALGEFGATLMIAGNIPGKTQTIPLAIYFAMESGDVKTAYFWVILIFFISLAIMLLANHWSRKYKTNKSSYGVDFY